MKKKGGNCLEMMVELIFILKVIKANLILDKMIILTLAFNGHFICFYQLHFSFKSKTIYKCNSVIKNIKFA